MLLQVEQLPNKLVVEPSTVWKPAQLFDATCDLQKQLLLRYVAVPVQLNTGYKVLEILVVLEQAW